jgi:heme oxygenase (biliverdin-producing, ferredoxin)
LVFVSHAPLALTNLRYIFCTMHTEATAPAGLAQQLKTATAALHRRAERSAFMARLLHGDIDRAHYVVLLHNLQALYTTLEAALQRHADHPAVSPVVMPALWRSRAIAADLQCLAEGAPPPLAVATQHYVQRLQSLQDCKSALLVAHAYVRYLGDLNGGQALRRVVARSLALAGDGGTGFYDFGGGDAAQRLALRFRDGLAAVAPHWPDPRPLIDEAVDAFDRHCRLFDELAAA